MPFAYFARLSRPQQKIYLASDQVTALRLPEPAALWPQVAAIEAGLRADERAAVERAASGLVSP